MNHSQLQIRELANAFIVPLTDRLIASISLVFAMIAAIAGGFSAFYAWRAVGEAHTQAVASLEQTAVAKEALFSQNRPWLKIVSITDTSISKYSDEIASIIKFNAHPVYKNLGSGLAQDVQFIAEIYVIGAGPNPEKLCRNYAKSLDSDGDLVFPQETSNDGGYNTFQFAFEKIGEEANKVLTIEPRSQLYLGVIGCLLYRGPGNSSVLISGFNGTIDLDTDARSKLNIPDAKYLSPYSALFQGPRNPELKVHVHDMNYWAE
ncbi:hypothetical protein [Acetobacter cerevisiae]|uniref:hypothetical protein n=1 Tax=Acetobacter cerevisiae TaxID=178900 RepID=UPI0020A1094A|nr:hypothetical protein [Acetobacter cerevisiae]MCP1271852.1 hypothetical protein [Acetobacter cerevisiae]MCP1279806.1 hypothetical protein [Acetobacter cerevisiae]